MSKILYNPFYRHKDINPLKYQSWDDISIKMYDDIVAINNDENTTLFEKNVKILSILWDKSEEEIMNENINIIQDIIKYTSFLSDFTFDNKHKPKSITIDNQKCTINYNLKEFTYAQFIDYQTFSQMGVQEHMQNILSTLIIPDGKKYGEGYDIDEFTQHIYNQMSITDAQNVMFFFALALIRSLDNSKTYLISQLKKMMKKETNQEQKEKLQEAITLLSGSIA